MTVSQVSPADLFMELWKECSELLPSQISTALRPNATFAKSVRVALRSNDGAKACSDVESSLLGLSPLELLGGKLVVLDEIDRLFLTIHPRSFNRVGTQVLTPPPRWLRLLKIKRAGGAGYAVRDDNVLIARGPLSRIPRADIASSAVCFADLFAALSVVPRKLFLHSVPINIVHSVKGGAADGVAPGGKIGTESVTFIPVAISDSDLEIEERKIGANIFVRYGSSRTVNVSEKITDALKSAKYSDVAIAPELICSELDADKLCDLIAKDAGLHRVFIAGSGATVDSHNGQHWNEARVVNGIGTVLWRQRKVWPAGLNSARALEYGLSDPGTGLSMEDNCSSNEVHVVDIDSFGRCVVLICQDFEAEPLAADLLRLYQPDWVFVPILDRGIDCGRWVHSRAFALSTLSPARFVVSSSTALADRAKLTTEVACGMAIGPKDTFGDDAGRVHALAYLADANQFATLKWREKWDFTLLSKISKK